MSSRQSGRRARRGVGGVRGQQKLGRRGLSRRREAGIMRREQEPRGYFSQGPSTPRFLGTTRGLGKEGPAGKPSPQAKVLAEGVAAPTTDGNLKEYVIKAAPVVGKAAARDGSHDESVTLDDSPAPMRGALFLRRALARPRSAGEVVEDEVEPWPVSPTQGRRATTPSGIVRIYARPARSQQGISRALSGLVQLGKLSRRHHVKLYRAGNRPRGTGMVPLKAVSS